MGLGPAWRKLSKMGAPLCRCADEEEGPITRACFMLGCEPVSSLAGSELHAITSTLVFLNGQLLGVHKYVASAQLTTSSPCV